jgi:nucleoside-diphosphate-sugar epimerase
MAVEVNAEIFLTFGSQAEVAPSKNLIDESTQEDSKNFYGSAKIKVHKTLNFIASNSITRIIWARLFTIYGPGDTRKSIITEGIRKVIAGEDFIIQHPNRKWSFLYIDDFTNAILTIVENEDLSGVINIGNPAANELGLVSEIISKSLNREPEQNNPAENADFDSVLTWIPKTQTLSSVGWQPQTTLHEGISKTIDWWRLKE